MTKRKAKARAAQLAARLDEEVHVIWEREEGEARRHAYHVATEEDLQTFYHGQDPILTVTPAGIFTGNC